jgi:hypothetical protein
MSRVVPDEPEKRPGAPGVVDPEEPSVCAGGEFPVDLTVGLELPLERPVGADATQAVNLTDNEGVRLIHGKRAREDSLREGDCYDHSYGEHVSDHVDVVHLEPAGIGVEIPLEVETEHHVTTERLKDQFEERLAARTRRSRSVRP